MLRHGAPHSAPGKGGWIPAAIAARGGASEIVEALLAAGADPNAPTPCGKSMRELAIINKKDTVVEALDRASTARAEAATVASEGSAAAVEDAKAAAVATTPATGKNAAKNKKKREQAKQKKRETLKNVVTDEAIGGE